MTRVLDVSPRASKLAAVHPYCSFAIDESGYPVRDVDLRSTYPYFCLVVNYIELRLLRAAQEEQAMVLLRDGKFQRAAIPIRITRQGVVSLKFVENPADK